MIINKDEIKLRANIVDIIGSFIPLHKKNGVFTANCPFHSEKTPSFVVNEAKGFFYCFGCNKGGDVFKFVEDFKHISFNEAIEEVANIAKLEIKKSNDKNLKDRKVFYEMLEIINEFLKYQLLNDKEALEEVKKRGFDEEYIKRYDLGLWKNEGLLIRKLKEQNLFTLAKKLNIFYENEKGIFTPFAKRLNFSIRNKEHKIIGFSARIRANENTPTLAKYINSKESFLYQKSLNLYNFSNAKNVILKENQVLVVEGYFDVLSCIKLGFFNVVASCGTAFTLSHLSLLNKMGELEYILSFDKDKAGIKANLKALEMFFKESIFKVKIRVLKSKRNKDFNDLLLSGIKADEAKEHFKDYDGFEYYVKMNLKECLDSKSKYSFFLKLKALILAQNNFFLKEELIKKACEFLQVDKKEFLEKKYKKEKTSFTLEEVILKNILLKDEYLYLAKEYLKPYHFKKYSLNFKNLVEKNIIDNDLMRLSRADDELLDREEFSLCLKELFKKDLMLNLEQAQKEKNINLILGIKEQLANL